MENKKWYKRTSTLFWFALATLPLIVSLISFIGCYFIHWGDNTAYADISGYLSSNNFITSFESNCSYFGNLTPSALKNAFVGLFNSFGGISSNGVNSLSYLFGWFSFTFLIHVIVDVVIWLPKLFHSWLDRWC